MVKQLAALQASVLQQTAQIEEAQAQHTRTACQASARHVPSSTANAPGLAAGSSNCPSQDMLSCKSVHGSCYQQDVAAASKLASLSKNSCPQSCVHFTSGATRATRL